MGFSVVGRKACIMASLLASVPIGLTASPVSASTANWGYISGLYGTNNGAILFSTSGARTAAPSCQGAPVPQRFAIDASTPAGQAAAAVLLNAYNLHRQIIVQGTGTCSIWGDTETVLYFQVADS